MKKPPKITTREDIMKHKELIFKYDKLRKQSDIRSRKVSELARYQLGQRNVALRQARELQDVQTSYAIRRTIDGTLLMEHESEGKPSPYDRKMELTK